MGQRRPGKYEAAQYGLPRFCFFLMKAQPVDNARDKDDRKIRNDTEKICDFYKMRKQRKN